jgi:DHA1 family multidrug resistance protein-like MFS transporter
MTDQAGARHSDLSSSNRRRYVLILSFTLIIITLGFGIVIPIFPFYIDNLGAGGSELGLLIAVASLMEFIFAPVWGSISDGVGRKPILILGVFGYALSMLLLGLAEEIWMLFIARGLVGVLSSATYPAAMAYIGDVTSEDERGGGMGTLGAAMGLGIIIGPAVGGLLAKDSLSMPFFLSSAFSMFALLLIVVLLPESLPKVFRKKVDWMKLVKLGDLRGVTRSSIGSLLFMAFLLSFGLSNFESVFGLYALEKFGYGPEEVGAILMVMGLMAAVGKGALTGPTTRRWGESTVIKASLLAGSIGFLIVLQAGTYNMILMATGFFMLSKTLLRPAVLSLTSKRSTIGQGAAMGLCNSFMSLGRIAGPIWAGYVFDINFNYPYISGSAILFIGFIASLILGLRDTNNIRHDPPICLNSGDPS